MRHTIKRFRGVEVICKVCGHQMGHYQGNPYWHCENPDMPHRGLVLDENVIDAVAKARSAPGWKRGKGRKVVV